MYSRINGLFIRIRRYFVSAGSACNSHSDKPSYVLSAMGLDNDKITKTLRISFDNSITEDNMDKFVSALKNVLLHLTRRESDSLKKIYLAGGMTGLTYKEQHEWRLNFISQIRRNDSGFDRPKFFDPPLYYDVNEVNDIETQKRSYGF